MGGGSGVGGRTSGMGGGSGVGGRTSGTSGGSGVGGRTSGTGRGSGVGGRTSGMGRGSGVGGRTSWATSVCSRQPPGSLQYIYVGVAYRYMYVHMQSVYITNASLTLHQQVIPPTIIPINTPPPPRRYTVPLKISFVQETQVSTN